MLQKQPLLTSLALVSGQLEIGNLEAGWNHAVERRSQKSATLITKLSPPVEPRQNSRPRGHDSGEIDPNPTRTRPGRAGGGFASATP
jgi:hypothetical protein